MKALERRVGALEGTGEWVMAEDLLDLLDSGKSWEEMFGARQLHPDLRASLDIMMEADSADVTQ